MKNTYKWYQMNTEGADRFDVGMMLFLTGVCGLMWFALTLLVVGTING